MAEIDLERAFYESPRTSAEDEVLQALDELSPEGPELEARQAHVRELEARALSDRAEIFEAASEMIRLLRAGEIFVTELEPEDATLLRTAALACRASRPDARHFIAVCEHLAEEIDERQAEAL